MNIYEPFNVIIIIIYIILIIILQTVLFNYVASDFIDIFLSKKTQAINKFIDKNSLISNSFDMFKNSDKVNNIRNMAYEQKIERQKINNTLLIPWIGLPLLISIIILSIFIYMGHLNHGDWKELGVLVVVMIIITVITQLFFYNLVIKQYDYYGNKKLYNNLYQGIKKNIVIEPTTPGGKKYNQTIDQLPEITKTFLFQYLDNKTKNLSTYFTDKENNLSEYLNHTINNLSEYNDNKTNL